MADLPKCPEGRWTITRWDDVFRAVDVYGDVLYARRNAAGHLLIHTYDARDRDRPNGCLVPEEHLVAWIAGEGPPEPPIEVGCRVRVRLPNSFRTGVVKAPADADDGDPGWQVHVDGEKWPRVYPARDLVRVPDGDGAA